MGAVEIQVEPPYRAHIGPGVLGFAEAFARAYPSAAVLADERAWALHGSRLGSLADAPRQELPSGEEHKGLAALERALEFLAVSELDRESLVLTFGGGVANDLGGLAASLYMRGIDVVHCPTTLLAQVDAAVGGKTAVNLRAGKNLAGTFHQPRAVFADGEVLATLDDGDFRSGLGEVVKAALIGAPGLLEMLERETAAVLRRDARLLSEIVEVCVRLKAAVVARDEREAGPRRALNLGHTFGHAIERVGGYGRVPHGVAVAVGLALAVEASGALGLLADPALPERLSSLLARLDLPSSLSALRRQTGLALEPEELVSAMRIDKKARSAEPRLVLPRRVGDMELEAHASEGFLVRLLSRS